MKKLLYLFALLLLFSCEKEDDSFNAIKGNWKLFSIYSKYYYWELSEEKKEIIKYRNNTLYYLYDYSHFFSEEEVHVRDTLIYYLQLSISDKVTVHCNFESIVTGEINEISYTGSYYEDEHSTHYIHGETFDCITFDIGNENLFINDDLYLKYENLGKDTLILEYYTRSFPDDMGSNDLDATYIFVKSEVN
ncbi:MAG: hypothetical protein KQH79_11370 [Bacteroidetes bacterium]|nr:hypothetical protein [Bacteroidota bacterium]